MQLRLDFAESAEYTEKQNVVDKDLGNRLKKVFVSSEDPEVRQCSLKLAAYSTLIFNVLLISYSQLCTKSTGPTLKNHCQ